MKKTKQEETKKGKVEKKKNIEKTEKKVKLKEENKKEYLNIDEECEDENLETTNDNDNTSFIDENEIAVIDNSGENNLIIKENNDIDIDKYNIRSLVSSKEDAFYNYVQHISQFPLLTQEEEEHLLNEYIDNGNQKAGQAIVLSHLRLVVKIAMQYKKFGINIMDVIAEGNVGLMIAMQKFNREKKARFSTYASLWVKAKIQDFILKSWSLVKIGSYAIRKQLLFNFNSLKKILNIDGNTSSEDRNKKISKHFGIKEKELNDITGSLSGKELSIEAKYGENKDYSLADKIESNDNVVDNLINKEENEYRQKVFKESMSILKDREREILTARYLNDTKSTLEELSLKYNISKERVRQIEETAIKKLKKFAEEYNR